MNLNTALKFDYDPVFTKRCFSLFDYESASNQTLVEAKPDVDKTVVFEDYKINVPVKEKEIAWWIGHVVDIEDDSFTAKLEDLSGRENIVEFMTSSVDPSDIKSLMVDAVFTYSISQIDKNTGREIKAKVAFSSPPRWSESLAEKAEALKQEIFPQGLFDF